ncbi:hypothetical protein QZH41_007883 [Actinostola sp. cb2023]|nr:hypothetical protein QZH41_007883 [Actinostola sp. cb2023]
MQRRLIITVHLDHLCDLSFRVFESTKALKPSSELHGAQRQYSTVSSDGWTLESTVGYSSANDADDETERQLETSEDFETYEDPQEIVDMTFGDGIEGSEEDRVSFEDLAEQLNLPIDDEDDIAAGGFISRPESECGADLEFDFGDYFDDKSMIVGEALRLKKVLGCDTEQDPELQTIVSAVTDPKVLAQINQCSSGEISSGSSLDDIGEKKGSPFSSVSYVGCEETKQIETLPRVKLSSQRKRRKEKVGYLSDQDIPKVVQNTINARLTSENSSDKLAKDSTRKKQVEPQNVESEKAEKVVLRKKAVPRINLGEKNSAPDRNGDTVHVVNGDQFVRFPHDDLPSPNSVNVFIDYKKNVMKVTTSTPKIHHGKLITESPTGVSPVAGSPNEERKASPPNSGQEEFPPRYDSGSSSERSSSVYSSDEEKFFGSSDTVVFVDKTTESQSDKPNVDVTLHQDQGACASNGYRSNQDDDAAAAKTDAYSARVDSLLQEVRSSLDLDSIGSDLLDQAMERVKDKLSPRSSSQDHIRRIDTASCLGLGPTSMYGAQIGATMLTPDGMTDSYDTLIYDTLIPKPIIEELKRTLADLMKCDISTPSDEVPVVVILDQLDCLASLADIFEPKQLDGNRNRPISYTAEQSPNSAEKFDRVKDCSLAID